MLDRRHRLTSATGFATAVRRGRRAGRRTLVVHLLAPGAGTGPVQVGVVVGRSVGNAVTRNLVKRRLRALARDRLGALPDAGLLVVRALPGAAASSYDELARDLDAALARASRSAGTPDPAGALR